MTPARRLSLALLLTLCSESVIAQTPLPAADIAKPWHASRYGEGDRIGAANNLSPEGVRLAAKLVKTGKTYALGVPTGPDTPVYGNRSYKVERLPSGGADATPDGSERVTAFDERVTLSMGIGTQIDGLAHLGVDHHYYNGVTSAEVIATQGKAHALDLSRVPPIVSRGLLLDMTKAFGKPMLEPGDVFNRKEIEAALKAHKLKVRKGDVVIFHTGWLDMATRDKARYQREQPGLGEEGAQWLADKGVVAIGADTIALEVIPFENPSRAFIVHQTLLAKNGVYILESLDTRELAKDGAREFLFVLGQPRFEGTVQTVINPVAIR
jgi:kynurenine formamidase